jgi:rRNA maturation protein Nop10
MSETIAAEDGKGNCPKCGEQFFVSVGATFKPETMTVAYKLEPGRLMGVEEFCSSVGALAKLLKLAAKELGEKVFVGLKDVAVSDGEVAATVVVLKIHPKDSKVVLSRGRA